MIVKPILHLGDCRDYLKTLADNSIDLIVTDPPYGIHFRSNRQTVDRKKSIHGEGSVVCRDHYFNAIEDDSKLTLDWIKEAYRILKEGTAMYVFCHWQKWPELAKTTEELGFNLKNMIVLNKSNHGMGDLKGSYAPKHELLLYAIKGRHELRFPQGRGNDVWNVPVKFSGARRFHPNEKPLPWLVPAIENSSDPGQVVLDPFMGSGSSGIAALNMGRNFVGVEKDKQYFDVAESRIQEALEKHDSEIL